MTWQEQSHRVESATYCECVVAHKPDQTLKANTTALATRAVDTEILFAVDKSDPKDSIDHSSKVFDDVSESKAWPIIYDC